MFIINVCVVSKHKHYFFYVLCNIDFGENFGYFSTDQALIEI